MIADPSGLRAFWRLLFELKFSRIVFFFIVTMSVRMNSNHTFRPRHDCGSIRPGPQAWWIRDHAESFRYDCIVQHAEPMTHSGVCMQSQWHTVVFACRANDTQWCLHAEPMTHSGVSRMQSQWHTVVFQHAEPMTHSGVCMQSQWHTVVFQHAEPMTHSGVSRMQSQWHTVVFACRANDTQWCFTHAEPMTHSGVSTCRVNDTQWCFTQEAILGEVTSLRIASFFYFKLSHHCVGFFHKKGKKTTGIMQLDDSNHILFITNLKKEKRKQENEHGHSWFCDCRAEKKRKKNSYTSVIQIKNVSPPFQKESTQRKQISRACYKAPHEHKDIFSVTRESFAQSEKRNLSEKIADCVKLKNVMVCVWC